MASLEKVTKGDADILLEQKCAEYENYIKTLREELQQQKEAYIQISHDELADFINGVEAEVVTKVAVQGALACWVNETSIQPPINDRSTSNNVAPLKPRKQSVFGSLLDTLSSNDDEDKVEEAAHHSNTLQTGNVLSGIFGGDDDRLIASHVEVDPSQNGVLATLFGQFGFRSETTRALLTNTADKPLEWQQQQQNASSIDSSFYDQTLKDLTSKCRQLENELVVAHKIQESLALELETAIKNEKRAAAASREQLEKMQEVLREKDAALSLLNQAQLELEQGQQFIEHAHNEILTFEANRKKDDAKMNVIHEQYQTQTLQLQQDVAGARQESQRWRDQVQELNRALTNEQKGTEQLKREIETMKQAQHQQQLTQSRIVDDFKQQLDDQSKEHEHWAKLQEEYATNRKIQEEKKWQLQVEHQQATIQLLRDQVQKQQEVIKQLEMQQDNQMQQKKELPSNQNLYELVHMQERQIKDLQQQLVDQEIQYQIMMEEDEHTKTAQQTQQYQQQIQQYQQQIQQYQQQLQQLDSPKQEQEQEQTTSHHRRDYEYLEMSVLLHAEIGTWRQCARDFKNSNRKLKQENANLRRKIEELVTEQRNLVDDNQELHVAVDKAIELQTGALYEATLQQILSPSRSALSFLS